MGIDGDTANMHQPKRQQNHRFTTTEWGEATTQPIKREKWDTGGGRNGTQEKGGGRMIINADMTGCPINRKESSKSRILYN